MSASLMGSEMCIRDSPSTLSARRVSNTKGVFNFIVSAHTQAMIGPDVLQVLVCSAQPSAVQ
eukprot:10346323-Alexandrium_andersonii.AAC.1